MMLATMLGLGLGLGLVVELRGHEISTTKSDWIFWSLARLIDLTKSQQTKKTLHVSTGSRDYSPGSLIGATQVIIVLTDLTYS